LRALPLAGAFFQIRKGYMSEVLKAIGYGFAIAAGVRSPTSETSDETPTEIAKREVLEARAATAPPVVLDAQGREIKK